jgi:hypothetical protein
MNLHSSSCVGVGGLELPDSHDLLHGHRFQQHRKGLLGRCSVRHFSGTPTEYPIGPPGQLLANAFEGSNRPARARHRMRSQTGLQWTNADAASKNLPQLSIA